MLLLKIGFVIFALYTFSSLPTLRQISSPIYVFVILNASIFLLSLGRITKLPDRTTQFVAAESQTPIGMEIEEEFEKLIEDEVKSVTEEEEVAEELSDAEFNRIVEAFLEKQKRFHYQENVSILV